jgi:predicted nucleic acid-binding Zn ribbon protein
MLTTHLAAAMPARVDELIREADAARLARAARPAGGRRPTARLALPAHLAAALRASLRRPTVSGPRQVCCT